MILNKCMPIVATCLIIFSNFSLAGTQLEENNMLKKYKVSFDCAKASSFSEKSACESPKIGQLDGLLAATYKSRSTPEFGQDPKKFREDQKKWLAQKNACTTNACVEGEYKKRISFLCEIPVTSGVHWDSDCDKLAD